MSAPRPGRFVHLHLHTQYSLLDGANKIPPLMEKCARLGMPAVAMTDHGNLFGALEFYREAQKHGVKPILGCELYVTPRSRFDREELLMPAGGTHGGKKINNASFHLTLLAENLTGYQNLLEIVSRAHLEGFYYRPRADFELLYRHREGLIALSGCLKGQVSYLLTRGEKERACATADLFRNIFGPGRYFFELQANGLEEQRVANRELLALSREMKIPVVATNDCHYLDREDALPHDILLCLQTGKTLEDPNRLRFGAEEFYLKSPDEVIEAFREIPEAVENTLAIAERIDLTLDLKKTYMPEYVPDVGETGRTINELFCDRSREGLEVRFGEKEFDDEKKERYRGRLEREIAVILEMGFAGYFLIVWDFIRKAREQGIAVGPGRGSAAGSLVAWSLRITNIDPIAFGLLFERFLNPERVSLPDIDVDFCMNRRGEVIDYVMKKYGADRVSMIATFGTMGAKASIRDVGRVLGMTYSEVDRVAKMIPTALEMTLEKALEQNKEFRELREKDPAIDRLVSLSMKLEGITRHASIHAAGIVISQDPLSGHVPLMRGAGGETVTQFTKDDVEKVGLVKFDFLGLTTLTLIEDAVRRIRVHTPEFDIDRIPLDDPGTYAFLQGGKTLGIFQLESRGMTDLLVKLAPEVFEDLIALLALYRPGPINSGMVDDFIRRKKNPKEIVYEHPDLEPILRETYGVIVYQEQVMQIANVLAGFSLGDADLLRRAMGKKKPEEMEKMKGLFITGAVERKTDRTTADHIFELMAHFAGYGFNKSHSAAYALISYQTAYLKAHYPVEFWAALLTNALDDTEKIGTFLAGARELDIRVLSPDINESLLDFTVLPDRTIRFGLGAVKNVGRQAVEAILEIRAAGGPFLSFPDFMKRIDGHKVNRRVVEALAKAGAFDSLGTTRAAAMANIDPLLGWVAGLKKPKKSKMGKLFREFEPEAEPEAPWTDAPEWDEKTLLKAEREGLGFYLSRHPMTPYMKIAEELECPTLGQLEGQAEGSTVSVFGIVSAIRELKTKKGDKMAQVTLMDFEQSLEMVLFPDTYASCQGELSLSAPLYVTGTLERNDFGTKLRTTRVTTLSQLSSVLYKMVSIRLRSDGLARRDLEDLREILGAHPGPLPSLLEITEMVTPRARYLIPTRQNVAPSEELIHRLKSRFGPDAVVLSKELDPALSTYLIATRTRSQGRREPRGAR